MTTSAPGAVTVRERLGKVIGCAGEMPADEANRAPGHHPRPGHRRRGLRSAAAPCCATSPTPWTPPVPATSTPWADSSTICARRQASERQPCPVRSAEGIMRNGELSRLDDVEKVFDYLAGRLDDTADGPRRRKAGLDRYPMTRRGIAVELKLHSLCATLANKPADGKHDGPSRQAPASPGRCHTEDEPDRARIPGNEPDQADGHWALCDGQEECRPVITAAPRPPGQPVGNHPQTVLSRRASPKRRQPCAAQTAVLLGGIVNQGINIPDRRHTQRHDTIGQDALRRRQGIHTVSMRARPAHQKHRVRAVSKVCRCSPAARSLAGHRSSAENEVHCVTASPVGWRMPRPCPGAQRACNARPSAAIAASCRCRIEARFRYERSGSVVGRMRTMGGEMAS